MNRSFSFFGLIFIFMLALSCKKVEERTAAFIKIEGDSLVTTAEQGDNTRSVPYVTIYQNDNPQGTYEPPGTYPIIAEGKTDLQLRGHIRRLARPGFFMYSLFDPYNFTADFKPNQDVAVKPIYRYKANTKIVWAEDFNNPALSLRVRSGDFDTLATGNEPEKQLNNTSYGIIKMKPDFSFFELESTEEFVIPKDQRDVYLELDYNCNVPFTIGLFAIDDQQIIAVPSVTPFATNGKWKKGYVFLTEDVMGEIAAKKFRILLRGQSLETFTPIIFLENMRLMHLE